MSKLVTRRVKRGKHVKRVKRGKRSRCGGKYSKRKGYSKHKKHYTRKYGRRNRTRSKRGGMLFGNSQSNHDKPLKFNLKPPADRENRWDDIGKGFIKVTKVDAEGKKSVFSKEDQLEQWYIYIDKGPYGFQGLPLYFIYRCPGEECEDKVGTYTSTNAFTKGWNIYDTSSDKFRFYSARVPDKKYKLTLIPNQEEQSLNQFFAGIKPDISRDKWIASLLENNPV